MRGKRCAEELKIEAIRQVTDSGYPVTEVVQRLGGAAHSLYQSYGTLVGACNLLDKFPNPA